MQGTHAGECDRVGHHRAVPRVARSRPTQMCRQTQQCKAFWDTCDTALSTSNTSQQDKHSFEESAGDHSANALLPAGYPNRYPSAVTTVEDSTSTTLTPEQTCPDAAACTHAHTHTHTHTHTRTHARTHARTHTHTHTHTRTPVQSSWLTRWCLGALCSPAGAQWPGRPTSCSQAVQGHTQAVHGSTGQRNSSTGQCGTVNGKLRN
jgi:hypothetical protein